MTSRKGVKTVKEKQAAKNGCANPACLAPEGTGKFYYSGPTRRCKRCWQYSKDHKGEERPLDDSRHSKGLPMEKNGCGNCGRRQRVEWFRT